MHRLFSVNENTEITHTSDRQQEIEANGRRIRRFVEWHCSAGVTLHSSKFISPWSSQGYFTQPVHGTVSPRQLIVDILIYCWNVRNVMVTVCLTYKLLKNYVMPQTINCLTKLFQTATMFYTVYCHHHLQRRSTIILGVVCTHFRFQSMTHIYLTNFVTHMLHKHSY